MHIDYCIQIVIIHLEMSTYYMHACRIIKSWYPIQKRGFEKSKVWDSPSPGRKVLRNRQMTARGKGMVGIAARKVPFFSRTSTTTPPPAAGAPTTIWELVPSLSAMSVCVCVCVCVVLSPPHTLTLSVSVSFSPSLSLSLSSPFNSGVEPQSCCILTLFTILWILCISSL